MADEYTPHDFAQTVMGYLTDTSEPEPETAAETEPETEATEPIVDARGNLHNPEDGKFVQKTQAELEAEAAEEAEEGEEQEAEEEEEEEEQHAVDENVDPAVAALLAKYGNDPVKALKAAAEAQSVIGRQGSELGDLRDQLAQLTQLVQQQVKTPPLQTVNFAALLDPESEQFNPEQAANIAVQYGDMNALQTAVQTWATTGDPEDAFKAAVFWSGLQQKFLIDSLAGELAKTEAAPPEQELDREVAGVISRHPEIEQYVEQIGALARERPLLAQALESGTPAQRAQALEDLYLLARGRDSDTLTQQVTSKAAAETKKAASKARSEAAVVSATRGTAATETRELSGVDRFRAAFAERVGLPDGYAD